MEEIHHLSNMPLSDKGAAGTSSPETPGIERLFASPALHATLAIFFDYPLDPLFPRLIARYTRTDIKSVLRELKKLQEIGVIRSRRAGRERHYRLNEGFPLHEELTAIFDKTRRHRRYAVPALWPDG